VNPKAGPDWELALDIEQLKQADDVWTRF